MTPLPFPFRFAKAIVPREDCSDWPWVDALKGRSNLSEEALEQVSGAANTGGGRPTQLEKLVYTTIGRQQDRRLDPDMIGGDRQV